jgi:hypothetical protein
MLPDLLLAINTLMKYYFKVYFCQKNKGHHSHSATDVTTVLPLWSVSFKMYFEVSFGWYFLTTDRTYKSHVVAIGNRRIGVSMQYTSWRIHRRLSESRTAFSTSIKLWSWTCGHSDRHNRYHMAETLLKYSSPHAMRYNILTTQVDN